MKKTMVSLVAGLALACSSLVMVPGQAVANNCSVSKIYKVGHLYHGFSSYCQAFTQGNSSHRAKAVLYMNSGYSTTKITAWKRAGVFSSSGYYEHGYVMNGPWLQIR